MRDFLAALNERVLLCDGAMGSVVQAMDLSVADDLGARTAPRPWCRPPPVIQASMAIFAAGRLRGTCSSRLAGDAGGIRFGRAGLRINRRAAELAREARTVRRRARALAWARSGRAPSCEPGTHRYDALLSAIRSRSPADRGRADAILIETCQDPLQIKAAVAGARAAAEAEGRRVPVMVQVTVETTGTLLVGADIAAAATAVQALGVESFGINCATGPMEMAKHVKWIAENWPGLISVQPNAGLPELIDGRTVYPLAPRDLADWHRRFVTEDGVNLVGGCCGTRPEHIAAVDAMLKTLGQPRPRPVARDVPLGAGGGLSVRGAAAYRQEKPSSPSASAATQRLEEVPPAPGGRGLGRLLAMAREQVREGSQPSTSAPPSSAGPRSPT